MRSLRSNLGHYNQIHPTLQKYIILRRSLAGHRDPNAVKEQSPPPEPEDKLVGDATEDSKPSLQSLETSTGELVSSREELLVPTQQSSPRQHARAFTTSRLVNGGGRARISRKGRTCASCL